MAGRRRRGMKLGGTSDKGTDFKNLSVDDSCFAAYCLYCASEMYVRNYPSGSMITLFFRLSKLFGRADEAGRFLKERVLSAVKKKKLNPVAGEKEQEYCFCDSKIQYIYKEDHDVDRNMSCDISLNEDIVNLFRCCWLADHDERFFSRLVASFLIKKAPCRSFRLLEKVPSRIEKALDDDSYTAFLSESLPLSALERKYISFLYRCKTLPGLKGLVDDIFRCGPDDAFTKKVLGIGSREYTSLVSRNGTLSLFGFIDENGEIEDDAVSSISMRNLDEFFTDLVREWDCSAAYAPDSFNVERESDAIVRKMLAGEGNFSVLLYGKPGSGKTEYVKSLVKASGLKALLFKNEAEAEGRKEGTVLCRLNLLLAVGHPDSVIIVDEADTLLETTAMSFFGTELPSRSKGVVNKMLENNRNKVVWIVNYTSQIDISTKRRFNFSLKFDEMPREQLRSIAASKLAGLDIDKAVESEILGLVEKYNITGSSVDNVVGTVKSLGSAEPDMLIGYVERILKENSLLLHGKAKMRENVNAAYDMRALNTSVDAARIVDMIGNAEAASMAKRSPENGVRMLFYGLSGTGKTEFARFIAEKLGKKILLKRASDLLSMWVGGTEKNIRSAFDEAERTGSILLLDEADSFFRDRENAHQSWEITQVNELLTQMEEYSGIMICTTNLKKIMDPAMNRRFHIIVEFRPLSADGIRCMTERYFGSYTFSERDLERVTAYGTVTPGDFGVLAQRMRFMKRSDIEPEFIIGELCRIQDEKNVCVKPDKSRVGFRIS